MSEVPLQAEVAALTRQEIRGRVAIVTLADPAHRNALSIDMSRSLAARVASAVADEGVSAIVVAAEPPVFCAGGSLDDLLTPRAPLREVYAGFTALRDAPVPTVAAVAGPAIGAGMNIALACDVVVAGRSARFDPRFLDLGIHPGGGHLWQLERAVGAQAAAALVLFGEQLSGAEAVARGLAYACVEDADALPTALRLADRAAGRSRELLIRTKQTLSANHRLVDASEATVLEQAAQEWSMAQPDFRRRVTALRDRLARRRADDGGDG